MPFDVKMFEARVAHCHRVLPVVWKGARQIAVAKLCRLATGNNIPKVQLVVPKFTVSPMGEVSLKWTNSKISI